MTTDWLSGVLDYLSDQELNETTMTVNKMFFQATKKRLAIRNRKPVLLPEELLAKIVDLLPTKRIFPLMSINKLWELACRSVIGNRKLLILSDHKPCDCKDRECRQFEVISLYGMGKEQVDQMLTSLLNMKKLRLFYNKCTTEEFKFMSNSMLYRQVIVQNAAKLLIVSTPKLPDDGFMSYPLLFDLQCDLFDASAAPRLTPALEALQVDQAILASDWDKVEQIKKLEEIRTSEKVDNEVIGLHEYVTLHAELLKEFSYKYTLMYDQMVTFSNLKKMTAGGLIPGIAAYPVLESIKLRILMSPIGLSSLPYQLLTSFDAWITFRTEADLNTLWNHIPLMVNLKRLILMGNFVIPEQGFDTIHGLEKAEFFSVCMKSSSAIRTDPGNFVNSLIKNNPDLKDLNLDYISIAESDWILMAGLSKLTHICFQNILAPGVTVTGMQTLLRGASRPLLDILTVHGSEEVIKFIDSEIEEIKRETGSSFDRSEKEIETPGMQSVHYHKDGVPSCDSDE
jgi:hypothetical protein